MKKLKVTYSAVSGGIVNGSMGYTIEFSGESFTVDDSADVIMKIENHARGLERKKMKPCILLKGIFPEVNAMVPLLKSLKDFQYNIIVEIVDKSYRSWYSFCTILRVILKDRKWASFTCNELWFKTDQKVDPLFITEPAPLLYLDTKKKGVYDYFVKESPYPWNILLKSPVGYVEKIVEV